MTDLTITFILLSITCVVVGATFFYDKEKKDAGQSMFAAAVLFLPILWAVYFIIR